MCPKEEIPTKIWYNEFTTKQRPSIEEFHTNIITQQANKRQAVLNTVHIFLHIVIQIFDIAKALNIPTSFFSFKLCSFDRCKKNLPAH